MNKVVPLALLSSFTLFTCAKRAPPSVAGSDEEMLDRYAARLEELRVKLQAENPGCAEKCSMTREVCDLSMKICEIAERQPERLQARCVSAREECASFGDACTSCRR
jgi:hypothetical protein